MLPQIILNLLFGLAVPVSPEAEEAANKAGADAAEKMLKELRKNPLPLLTENLFAVVPCELAQSPVLMAAFCEGWEDRMDATLKAWATCN